MPVFWNFARISDQVVDSFYVRLPVLIVLGWLKLETQAEGNRSTERIVYRVYLDKSRKPRLAVSEGTLPTDARPISKTLYDSRSQHER